MARSRRYQGSDTTEQLFLLPIIVAIVGFLATTLMGGTNTGDFIALIITAFLLLGFWKTLPGR